MKIFIENDFVKLTYHRRKRPDSYQIELVDSKDRSIVSSFIPASNMKNAEEYLRFFNINILSFQRNPEYLQKACKEALDVLKYRLKEKGELS